MADFKVFYSDGSTYIGDAYDAPALGVLVIVEQDSEHGRRVISTADYYCWDDRGDGFGWWEADFVGMIDYLQRPGPKRVLIGRMVSNVAYGIVYQQAMNDPDFPPKTAWSLRNQGRIV